MDCLDCHPDSAKAGVENAMTRRASEYLRLISRPYKIHFGPRFFVAPYPTSKRGRNFAKRTNSAQSAKEPASPRRVTARISQRML
jgi:hypothetical protein